MNYNQPQINYNGPFTYNGESLIDSEWVISPDPMLDVIYQVFQNSGMAIDVVFYNRVFPGYFSTADNVYLADPKATAHQLRYRNGVPLIDGSIIMISGDQYKVMGYPQRINSGEKVANLVLQP